MKAGRRFMRGGSTEVAAEPLQAGGVFDLKYLTS